MKFNVQSILPAVRSGTGSDFELNRSDLPEGIPWAHNALRASLMYLVAAAIAWAGEVYLALQMRAWQVFVLAGIGTILLGMAAMSVILVRRGRFRLGVWWLIGASLTSLLATPFLIASFGLILGLGTILVVLAVSLQTLPPKEVNWALLASVAVAIVAGGLDLLAPASQLIVPAFGALMAILGGITILVFGALAVPQFRVYPLTTKLILAFLAVSLLALGLLAFLNERHTRAVLIEKAQQALLAAASKTAADIDTFINDNLEAIHTEAQLPVLAAYLSLPVEQRPGSPEEEALAATLRELSRKDKVFIASYALLDSQGRNVIDTVAFQTGQDESGRDYFQKPLETGLPYLSPVEFVSSAAENSSQTLDDAGLYFSSPVHNSLTGEVMGVLRVQYKPIILQQLVVQNNGLIGEQSLAILFDENYIRLAHGGAPDLILQPARAFDSNQITKLQAAGRLPAQQEIQPSTASPDLVAGLDNAIFEPYFTTQLDTSGAGLNLAVVKELETQPWLVVFAQPQDLFLAPIQEQTRTTLFLAIVIAGVVAVAAFAMGQFLAGPLVHLTEVVTRFTSGDLEARAHLKSGDESGVLAASFNKMAEEVGSLLKNLAERTYELEAEIGERQRAEAGLQASEKKYRTLFEDSRDVIFISTPAGQIIDMNPAGLKFFGYTRAELKDVTAQDLHMDLADRQKFQQEIEQYGSVRDFPLKFVSKDGAVRDCLVTATVRQADDGTILAYQGIIRDITEQKRIERERMRLLAIERELTLAQEIQQSLLPPAHPKWAGPDVVCYSLPAREMGGDLYAYHAFEKDEGGEMKDEGEISSFILHPSSFAIAVGDVSGKGMPAALLMAVSVASFQAIIGQGLAPKELLSHLDQAIALYTSTTGQNCALIYLEITLYHPLSEEGKGGVMRVANAGCVMPLVRRADGSVGWIEVFGTPLGMQLSAEFPYQEAEVSLAPGDLIILTSDGVVEANNKVGEMFGFDRLEQAVATGPSTSAEAMLEHLKAAVAAFVGTTEPHDDLTIVVVQV
ncbi:MAG TPA: SpoIIE family protein phosphatase [Anaerolineae bacterium]|nr:SpoIIE family protein phosphatase [Anaerolineae bacterium]